MADKEGKSTSMLSTVLSLRPQSSTDLMLRVKNLSAFGGLRQQAGRVDKKNAIDGPVRLCYAIF
jgi:hypothetical protein